MMTFYIVAAIICVLLSAFFSAAEMALSSANRESQQTIGIGFHRMMLCIGLNRKTVYYGYQ